MELTQVISKLVKKDYYKSRNGIIIANLSISVILKGINIIISLLMVPIALNYLEKTRYGLWAALSSVLSWFFIFDVGIGNGLRNKYIELKAKSNISEIKNYVSTAYFLFGLLLFIIIIIFLIINNFINWSTLLKAPESMRKELTDTVAVVFIVLCLNFILRLIHTILSADMKQAASDIISTIAHIISFLGILIISKVTSASILKYALIYTGSQLLVMLIASFILFNNMYKDISPSIFHIRKYTIRSLLTVGLSFFTIQLALMAFTHLPNFMISNILGPEFVTDYAINMRYFSLVSMIFTMMTYPLWSGFGDAHYRGDYKWVKKTMQRLYKLAGFVLCILIIMVILQKQIFKYWLSNKIKVDYNVSILFVIYYALYMIVSINGLYVNALSKLRLQMIISFPLAGLFIVSSIYLMKNTTLGYKSVLLSQIFFWGIPYSYLLSIQARKLQKGATGIWSK